MKFKTKKDVIEWLEIETGRRLPHGRVYSENEMDENESEEE